MYARFNDAFHNEVVMGKIGFVGKKWAVRLVLGFSYSDFYKEIQTGVYQEIVFGQKHRKGHSFVPSLEYRKRNLLVENLDLTVTANYNHNITNNIDTAAAPTTGTGSITRRTAAANSRCRTANRKTRTGTPR